MKKIFLVLVGLILLGCSSAEETSTTTGYYSWYDDYYYGYYDDHYYDNGIYWDDLSDDEKKEVIENIVDTPEFQEYVEEKLEDRFPDGIPQVDDRERTKEDILKNKDEVDRDIKEMKRPPVSNEDLFFKDGMRQPRTRNLKR